MFDTPVKVPDQISTLELSKIWLYKALQNLQPLPQVEDDQDPQADSDESR